MGTYSSSDRNTKRIVEQLQLGWEHQDRLRNRYWKTKSKVRGQNATSWLRQNIRQRYFSVNYLLLKSCSYIRSQITKF